MRAEQEEGRFHQAFGKPEHPKAGTTSAPGEAVDRAAVGFGPEVSRQGMRGRGFLSGLDLSQGICVSYAAQSGTKSLKSLQVLATISL